jgi:hypothetical protein
MNQGELGTSMCLPAREFLAASATSKWSLMRMHTQMTHVVLLFGKRFGTLAACQCDHGAWAVEIKKDVGDV